MRIYIEGNLSQKQDSFILSTLFFGNTEGSLEYETDYISRNCFSLEADECECALSDNGTHFSARWKGVTTGIEENNEIILLDDGDIALDKIIKMIQENHKKIVNGSAYYDTDVTCILESLCIQQSTPFGEMKYKFDPRIINTPIEFKV